MKTTLGSCACGGGSPAWMVAPVQVVAQYSPLLALARAWRVPFAPFVMSCRATFADDSPDILTNVALENGQGRLTQISVVDRMIISVTQPDAFAGNIFKNQSDATFKTVSGIQATINVDGAPRYAVAPFFTPIETLADVIGNSPAWPMGWILTYTQTIVMQFQLAFNLQSTPTNIVCSYRMWQPYGTDEFVSMSNGQAFTELRRLYANDADFLKELDMAQNAPVGR